MRLTSPCSFGRSCTVLTLVRVAADQYSQYLVHDDTEMFTGRHGINGPLFREIRPVNMKAFPHQGIIVFTVSAYMHLPMTRCQTHDQQNADHWCNADVRDKYAIIQDLVRIILTALFHCQVISTCIFYYGHVQKWRNNIRQGNIASHAI